MADTITPTQGLVVTGQGIAAGEFDELVRTIRTGVTVVVMPHPVYGTPLIAPVLASQQKRSNEGDKPSDGP